MSATQGHDVRGYYLHEDNGLTTDPTDSDPKAFGANPQVQNAEGSNNVERIFQFASPEAQKILKQYFEGAWGVSFQVTDPWWLNLFYGPPSTEDNADGSYTHTWSDFDPEPIRIPLEREPSGDVRTLKGAVPASGSISLSERGIAEVQLSGAYAVEGINTPASLTDQPAIPNRPWKFGDASLTVDGTSQALVQSGSFDFNGLAELVYEWGSDVAVDHAPRTFEPSFQVSKIQDAGKLTDFESLYGSAGATEPQTDVAEEALEMTLDNGKAAGSGINKMVITMTGAVPDSVGESGLAQPTEDVINDIAREMRTASIAVTNEVQTAR